MPTAPQLPSCDYGDAVFTRHDDGSLTCDHAGPRIRISDVLLREITSGKGASEASLMLPDGRPLHGKPARPQDLLGAMLTFDCANRRLVYRITGWEPIWLEGDPDAGSYLAEWPSRGDPVPRSPGLA